MAFHFYSGKEIFMKKILVVSDTHRNRTILKEVLEKNIKDIDILIHLGDDYEDIDFFKLLLVGKEIYQVPGIYHPRYRNGALPAVKTLKIEGWNIALVHNLEDLFRKKILGDINFYGHTHKAEIFARDEKIYVNPGHLKDDFDRGFAASYAIMEITPKSVDIKIITLSGKIIKEKIKEKTEE